MSVKIEASGRRSIQVEVEVPGTPEEVWQAIASGPGISSWFAPTEFEERDGKPVAACSLSASLPNIRGRASGLLKHFPPRTLCFRRLRSDYERRRRAASAGSTRR
jgi:hypothetical protein